MFKCVNLFPVPKVEIQIVIESCPFLDQLKHLHTPLEVSHVPVLNPFCWQGFMQSLGDLHFCAPVGLAAKLRTSIHRMLRIPRILLKFILVLTQDKDKTKILVDTKKV